MFTSRSATPSHLFFSIPSPKTILSEHDVLKAVPTAPTITIVPLDKKEFNIAQPEGILAFDLDNTLLDCEMSKQEKKIVLKNPEEIIELLEKAKRNNVMVVIVTSRYYIGKTFMPDYLNIDKVLDILGKHYFTAVYYTNAGPKEDALIELNNRFFPKDEYESRFHDICLVDDQKENLEPCYKAGFDVIDITKDEAYTQINDFLTTEKNLELLTSSIETEQTKTKKRKQCDLPPQIKTSRLT